MLLYTLSNILDYFEQKNTVKMKKNLTFWHILRSHEKTHEKIKAV